MTNMVVEHWKDVMESVEPETNWDSMCQTEDEVRIFPLFEVSEILDILPSSVDQTNQFAGNCLCIC